MKLKKSLGSLLIIGLISAPAAIYAWSASVFNHTPYDVYVYSNGEPSPGPGLAAIPSGKGPGVRVSPIKKNCPGMNPLNGRICSIATNWVIQAGIHSGKIATVTVAPQFSFTSPLSNEEVSVSYPTSPGQQKRNVPYDIQLDVDDGGTNVDITVNPYPIIFHINVINKTNSSVQVQTKLNQITTAPGDNVHTGVTPYFTNTGNFSYTGIINIFDNAMGNITQISYELTYIGFTEKGINGGDASLPENWEIQFQKLVSPNAKVTVHQGSGLNLNIYLNNLNN